MTQKLFLTFFSFFLFVCSIHSQVTDSSSVLGGTDSAEERQTVYLDSGTIQHGLQLAEYKSFLAAEDKPVVSDVQQIHSSGKNTVVFSLLFILMGLLTYAKVVFSKDIEELLQSFVNSNIAQQIFRSQSSEISFSSFLLHSNFVIALSLYVQFILVRYFYVTPDGSFSSILILIFLFTFFYLVKIISIKFVGVVFEVNEECEEYIFNFSIVCKTLGLTLIPALFIFNTASQKIHHPVFVVTNLIFCGFALIFIWRGLSTGYKLLYRSMYHFFIYVCVVEISPIFLLFKLLTKTIT